MVELARRRLHGRPVGDVCATPASHTQEGYFASTAANTLPCRHIPLGVVAVAVRKRLGLNTLFIASRLPFEIGDLMPPALTSHATSNFIHLCVSDSEIELIGVRAPSYRGSDRRAYREELTAILHSAQDRAMVVTGDLNEDPF